MKLPHGASIKEFWGMLSTPVPVSRESSRSRPRPNSPAATEAATRNRAGREQVPTESRCSLVARKVPNIGAKLVTVSFNRAGGGTLEAATDFKPIAPQPNSARFVIFSGKGGPVPWAKAEQGRAVTHRSQSDRAPLRAADDLGQDHFIELSAEIPEVGKSHVGYFASFPDVPHEHIGFSAEISDTGQARIAVSAEFCDVGISHITGSTYAPRNALGFFEHHRLDLEVAVLAVRLVAPAMEQGRGTP
jgi:hypothetical protein